MKKLNLKLEGIKEMLSKTEMKKVLGGYSMGLYACCVDNGGPCSTCEWVTPQAYCKPGTHLASCT